MHFLQSPRRWVRLSTFGLAPFALVCVTGCFTPAIGEDAGSEPSDAGVEAEDAGPLASDAGTEIADAGSIGSDAGPTDAGVECVFSESKVLIDAPFVGDLYLDGEYTGLQTPAEVDRWQGVRSVGVGGGENGYLRADLESGDECSLWVPNSALVAPRIWRARYINLKSVTATLDDGTECAASLDNADADRSYDAFLLGMQQHVEPFSHGTIEWEVERVDVEETLALPNHGWGISPVAPTVEAYLQDVTPGDLDLVMVFYRSSGPGCVIPAPFFGADFGTSPESREAGFVVVKLQTEDSIDELWNYFEENDPGVWVHEWLHTVTESYYGSIGAPMPLAGEGGMVHSSEMYGYEAPWMDWYADLMAGRVLVDGEFYGITPEILLECTFRERLTNAACQ